MAYKDYGKRSKTKSKSKKPTTKKKGGFSAELKRRARKSKGRR